MTIFIESVCSHAINKACIHVEIILYDNHDAIFYFILVSCGTILLFVADIIISFV